MTDSSEVAPRARGALTLRDRETGERRELTVTDAVSTAYRARFQAFVDDVMAACAATRVRYVRAPTDVSALDVLAEAARSAGLVSL